MRLTVVEILSHNLCAGQTVFPKRCLEILPNHICTVTIFDPRYLVPVLDIETLKDCFLDGVIVRAHNLSLVAHMFSEL